MHNTNESRRDFLTNGARLGAAAAVLAHIPAALAENAPSPEIGTDILRALGARIGMDSAAQFSARGDALTVLYFDAAGDSADALREGLAQGIAWHTGVAPHVQETQAHYGATIGVAVLTNARSGETLRVEVLPTALSMASLIESTAVPGSLHKQAIMATNADNLYRFSA